MKLRLGTENENLEPRTRTQNQEPRTRNPTPCLLDAELNSKDAAPEVWRGAKGLVDDRRIRELLPRERQLHLDPTIWIPIPAKRDDPVRVGRQHVRARARRTRAGRDAAEGNPFN